MKKSVFSLLLVLQVSLAIAQVRYVSLEIGSAAFSAKAPKDDNIRASHDQSLSQFDMEFLTSYDLFSAALKLELPVKKGFTFSTGAKYSQSVAEFGKNSGWLSDNFFFYKFREQQTVTEYLSVQIVEQRASYICIPLDMRYYPFLQRRFNLYFRASVDLSFKISDKTEVDFLNEEMSIHENELASRFRQPSSFNAMGMIGPGFNIGREGKTKVGMEVCVPTFFLSGTGGIVKPTIGASFNFFLKVPINPVKDEE